MISMYARRMIILFLIVILAITTICMFTLKQDDTNTRMASSDNISEKKLIPGGHSIGVRMDVKGVLIVGLEDIITIDGTTVNPGKKAGLEIGDTIIEVNGTKVYKATEVQKIVNEIKGDLNLKIQRKDKIMMIELVPVIAKEDELYKLGVWIKDKTAGIGTLTYYDPENKTFGALGHGIIDADTGVVLDINDGELLDSKVESVKEGKFGKPGEIHGIFYESEDPIGELKINSEFGIFGSVYEKIENPEYASPVSIASQDEIYEGKAYILTTIEGDNIERFEIEIERINPQKEPDIKSMIIRVTDKKLLEKTGGIVQGMSGSPIIQDGKLIGAVTHVLVNDPARGYGIFIENMLNAAE